jgi:predicted nucleic acid-binding protein
MTRIFWDTSLFLYLFKGGHRGDEVKRLRERMIARGDRLVTSSLTLGEVLARPMEAGDDVADKYEAAITRVTTIVPFDLAAARRHAALSADRSIAPHDLIQLACAAAAGIDMFITHDDRLSGKVIGGVKFIASLDRAFL